MATRPSLCARGWGTASCFGATIHLVGCKRSLFSMVRFLFDHNYYENGIDKFFNLLLVLGTPLLGTWLLLQRKIGASNMEKRLRRLACVVSESGSQD